MKSLILFCFALLAMASMPRACQADLIITYTGTFDFDESSDSDLLGLDGAEFIWTGVFDPNANPSFTNGANLDRFAGVISLNITGSVANDGVYTPAFSNTISELSGGTSDQYQFGNSGFFNIAGVDLFPGAFLVPSGFTGAVSATNTLTPFNSADIITALSDISLAHATSWVRALKRDWTFRFAR